MTYTNKVKTELLNEKIENKSTFFAEMLGIFLSKKSITNDGIYYKTENYDLALYIINNIKKFSKIDVKFSYKKSFKFKEHNEYIIKILNENKYYSDFLNEILLYKDLKYTDDESIKKHIVKGFFLASAYIKDPSKGYSLDFFIDSEDAATFIYLFIKKLKNKVSITNKKNKQLVYIRNNECILDILNLLDLHKLFFEFQEIVINKEMKNNIIRNMNYEIANETKKLNTINKIIEIIQYIDENYGVENLKDNLKQFCEYRLKYNELSLQELADKMNLTKSGVRGRIKRLEKIYSDLKGGKSIE